MSKRILKSVPLNGDGRHTNMFPAFFISCVDTTTLFGTVDILLNFKMIPTKHHLVASYLLKSIISFLCYSLKSRYFVDNVICTLMIALFTFIGWGAVFSRVPSDLVRAVPGSDVTFQWSLAENLTSLPDFQALVFGLWRHGFVATYITTVTRNGQVIPNPDLKKEAPRLDGRVQWKGNLSKSLVAFQISDVRIQDQTDYGLLLNFGPFRHSPTDSVRLEVEGKDAARIG